jgi:hypothetical protein
MIPPELRALIFRYTQIGCLLDDVDEDGIRSGDPAALAGAQLILAEADRVKREIDAFIDRAQLERSRH